MEVEVGVVIKELGIFWEDLFIIIKVLKFYDVEGVFKVSF